MSDTHDKILDRVKSIALSDSDKKFEEIRTVCKSLSNEDKQNLFTEIRSDDNMKSILQQILDKHNEINSHTEDKQESPNYSYYSSGAKHSTIDEDGNYVEWAENGKLKLKITSNGTRFYDEHENVAKIEHFSDFYQKHPNAQALKNKLKFLLDCNDMKKATEVLESLCQCIAVKPEFESRITGQDGNCGLISKQSDFIPKMKQVVVLESGKVALGEVFEHDQYVNHPIDVQNNGIEWWWGIRGSVIDIDKGELLWQEKSPRMTRVRHRSDPDKDLWNKIVNDLVSVSYGKDKKINFHMATGKLEIHLDGRKTLVGSEPVDILSSVEVRQSDLKLPTVEQKGKSFFGTHLHYIREYTDKSFKKAEQEKRDNLKSVFIRQRV